MNATTLPASQFLHRGNNPGFRLDAGLGLMLRKIIDGENTTMKDLEETFAEKETFTRWKKSLRQKKSLKDVVNHILLALLGRKSQLAFDATFGDEDPKNPNKTFSPEVLAGATKLAKALCKSQADEIREETRAALENAAMLQTLGED